MVGQYTAESPGVRRGQARVERLKNRRRTQGRIVVSAVTFLVAVAALAPVLAPHDPLAISIGDRLTPPIWHEGGSSANLLGTDSVGRDILSRVIFGTRITLMVASIALVGGALVGSIIGMIAGFQGGKTDAALMRLAEMTMGVPIVLLALMFAATLGPGLFVTVIAIVAVLWARFAVIVRAEVLTWRSKDFVLMAKVAGSSTSTILTRHIFPNALNTIIVMSSLQLGWTILVSASLSFLGAGIPPPAPEWGSMTSAGLQYTVTAYWVPIMPGLAIVLAVLIFNAFGDWLRDRIDPRIGQ